MGKSIVLFLAIFAQAVLAQALVSSKVCSDFHRGLSRVTPSFVAMGKSIVLFLLTIGAQCQESPYSTSDYLADTLMDRALSGCVDPAELDDATVGKGGAARARAPTPTKGGKVDKNFMPMSPGTGAYEAYPGFKPGQPVANGAGFTQTLPDPRVAGDYKASIKGNIFGREKMAKGEMGTVGVKTKMDRPQRWGQQKAENGMLPCQMPPKKKNVWR